MVNFSKRFFIAPLNTTNVLKKMWPVRCGGDELCLHRECAAGSDCGVSKDQKCTLKYLAGITHLFIINVSCKMYIS